VLQPVAGGAGGAAGGGGLRCAVWIVDEAHNSECPTGRGAAAALGAAGLLGLTATPYRASHHETLSLFDELLYSYGPAEALEDGVVVPFEVRPWEGLEGISINDACAQMIRGAVAEGLGPGLVDAGGWDRWHHRPMAGTDDADAFAARLVDEGVRAAAIHIRVPAAERRRRLAALEAGELDVVVHVSMLKEGVDLPFLRWLCLRRRVGSRVHFAQHVGRALRAAPGKARAVIFDPHDLFGAHTLSVAAALNAGDDGPEPSPMEQVLALLARERAVRGPTQQLLPLRLDPGDHGQAEALAGLERWLRRLTIALDATGIIVREADSPTRGAWRRMRASPKQLGAVKAHARRLRGVRGVPEGVRSVLREVYINAIRGALSRGACSDLLDVVFGLARRGWSEDAGRMLGEGYGAGAGGCGASAEGSAGGCSVGSASPQFSGGSGGTGPPKLVPQKTPTLPIPASP